MESMWYEKSSMDFNFFSFVCTKVNAAFLIPLSHECSKASSHSANILPLPQHPQLILISKQARVEGYGLGRGTATREGRHGRQGPSCTPLCIHTAVRPTGTTAVGLEFCVMKSSIQNFSNSHRAKLPNITVSLHLGATVPMEVHLSTLPEGGQGVH